jgi:hypothetical protein
VTHDLDQPLDERGILHWGALFEQFTMTEGWQQFRAWLKEEAARVAFAGCRDDSRPREYWAGLLDGIERISDKPEEIVSRASELLQLKADAETQATRRAQGLPSRPAGVDMAPAVGDHLFTVHSPEGDRL